MQRNRMQKYACLAAVSLVLLLTPALAAAQGLAPIDAAELAELRTSSPLAELGKKLFFDRRLSGDGTMSCATCHIPELGFGDGQAISLNYPTTKNWRNAPTLINVGLNKYLFYDGRVKDLAEQALFPILSAFEMNQNLDFLEEELRSVPAYQEEFKAVFGSTDTSRERVASAIAAFERTITSGNAPLDQFLLGKDQALSAKAKAGYKIFIGKGNCVKCHFGKNMSDDNFHALNVPEHPQFQNDARVAATKRFVAKYNNFKDFKKLDTDPGRYLITKEQKDWRAFKTPTLREITQTGPYMHNGIFKTLAEVIDFFNVGAGSSNTVVKPLGLTEDEQDKLEIFLTEALAGEKLAISFPDIP